MKKKKEQAYHYLELHKKELITLLQDMVRFPSVYLQEEGIQKYMAAYLEGMGASVDFWYPDILTLKNHSGFSSLRENFDTSPMVVARFAGKGGGRSLLINGHIDVVPEGEGWDQDPFGGHLEKGRLYGRGANDMKGGLAAAIFALRCLQAAGIQLRGDVLIESVIDEELGGAGTLAALLRGYTADGALIPEPSQYALVPANQGSAFFQIQVKGKKAHGAHHYLGVNAIKKGHFIMDKLDELEAKRHREGFDPLFSSLPLQVPISVGKFHAGTWPSMSPDLALLEGRYGMTTKESVEEARHVFEAFLLEACQEDPWLKENPPTVVWKEFWNSGSTDIDSPLVKTLAALHRELEGKEPLICGWAAPTDLSILTRFGGIPTVVYGPGNDSLHQSNEYIDIDDLLKYTHHIIALLIDWCGVEEEA